MKCKVSWNKIVKGTKILVLNSFGTIYVCEIHGRRMVWHTSYT
jgi:hypothetical protein